MKDHSRWSKAFFISVLIMKFLLLPIELELVAKERDSCAKIILSEVLIWDKKADCSWLIKLGRNFLILIEIILVMSL